jgi:serine protease AprX
LLVHAYPRSSLVRSASLVIALVLVLGALGTRAISGDAADKSRKHPKLDRHLEDIVGKRTKPVRVIVRTARGKSLAVGTKVKNHGGAKLADLTSVGGFVATVDGAGLAKLEQDPDVVGVSTDAVITSFASTFDVSATGAMLDEVLGIDTADRHGANVGIAVVDSGLDRGRDLDGGRTDTFFDVIDPSYHKAFDDYGHGTHVAGLIGGTGRQSRLRRARRDRNGRMKVQDVGFYAGVAPEARIVAFKVLDENGAGYTSQVIQAIDYIVENRNSLKIDIINLSLGHPILEPASTDPLVIAVERAVRAGIVVVAAAGNYGYNPETGVVGYAGITSPGNAPSAITVGAYDTHETVSRFDDTIPAYSSRGPTWFDGYAKPDFVAPGTAMVSTAAPHSMLFRSYPARQVRDRDGLPSYFRLSGTSMATAVASGTIALMIDAAHIHKAKLTPNAIKAILQYTALPMDGYDLLTQGAGSMNTAGAIEMAGNVDPRVAVGAYWLTDVPSGATTIDGVAFDWGQRVIWGSRVIWGNTLDINQPTWGQRVIWGSTATDGSAVISGSRVIWGSNVVWDQPGEWAQSVIWGSGTIGVTNGSRVIWGSSEGLNPDTIVWRDTSNED